MSLRKPNGLLVRLLRCLPQTHMKLATRAPPLTSLTHSTLLSFGPCVPPSRLVWRHLFGPLSLIRSGPQSLTPLSPSPPPLTCSRSSPRSSWRSWGLVACCPLRPNSTVHAKRLGRLPDDPTNARPRPLICCLHDFQDRERILRRRDKALLFFRGGKIFIFPDMISSVSEKRATFLGVKRQLYDRKVRYSLRHPARLHVEHSGEWLVFDSAGEAQKWYVFTFQQAN
ncbi:hypothetical protein DPEC_G00053450 [Dallia pectoralis]|uniref:Uncharacterized protein n=1 Tax=Dallia pectoralis TaxID=75939 RepID=A0ACC2H4R1_DALPE|nr:hypothetical protein DPEC_G00053450 [Dallia pectoralis]